MITEEHISRRKLRDINLKKYQGVEPTLQIVLRTMRLSGIKKMETFELSFGLPRKTIVRYKMGIRGLPASYWHIFYDFEQIRNGYAEKRSKTSSAKLKADTVNNSNKSLLNELADRFQK